MKEQPASPCAHSVLERLDEFHPGTYMLAGVYRCPACGSLAWFPVQSVPGMRELLEKAVKLDSE